MSQLLTIFSAESNKQWNYTVQPVAMESGQAWDRSTPTYMCSGSLLMSLLMFFFFFIFSCIHTHTRNNNNNTAHIKGHSWMCCLPYFQQNIFLSGTWEKHRYHFCPRRIASRLHAGCLASHEGDSEALKSLCVLVPYDSASAVLCSAHSCCASPTALSVTWRS